MEENDVSARSRCGDCEAIPGSFAAPEGGIGRRTFLVQTGILAAIAALNACGSLGGSDVTAPTIPSNSSIKISDFPSLANVGGVAMTPWGAHPSLSCIAGLRAFLPSPVFAPIRAASCSSRKMISYVLSMARRTIGRVNGLADSARTA